MNAIIMNLSVYYVTKALKCKRLFQVSMQYKFRSLKLCNNDEQESFFLLKRIAILGDKNMRFHCSYTLAADNHPTANVAKSWPHLFRGLKLL